MSSDITDFLAEHPIELVGHLTSFSSGHNQRIFVTQGLFFLGEYGNMILMSSMSTILFLGGWLLLVNESLKNCGMTF